MSYARFKRVSLEHDFDVGGPVVKFESDCVVDAENVAICSEELGFVRLELKQIADTSTELIVRGSVGEVAEKLDAARRRG